MKSLRIVALFCFGKCSGNQLFRLITGRRVQQLCTLERSPFTNILPSKSGCPRRLSKWAASGILTFVYRNRFALASQIQRRFAQYLKSDRTARRHLSEMQALGYLDVALTNNTSPLWPKVYFVTKQGLKRLQQAYSERGRTWKPYLADRKRSEGHSAQHVLHELFTTEFLLMAWETAQRRDEFELLKVERRSLVKHPAFRFPFAGKETRLEPDAMFLYRQNGKGMMCCFVETDMGTMSSKQLQTKFERYS